MFTKVRSEKGFTLIELLIVVAIIGILAAVAIPQFAAYRIRGFNSAALADLRNAKTGEEALFADWQGYGISTTEAAATPQTYTGGSGAGGALVGPVTAGNVFAVSLLDRNNNAQGTIIPVSASVTLIATTNAVAAGEMASSFTALTKHLSGDTAFGTDNDTTAIYRDTTSWAVATAVVAGDEPASVPQQDDYALIATFSAM